MSFKFELQSSVILPDDSHGIVISRHDNLAIARRSTIPVYENVTDGLAGTVAGDRFAIEANGNFFGYRHGDDGMVEGDDTPIPFAIAFLPVENSYSVAVPSQQDGETVYTERDWAESALTAA